MLSSQTAQNIDLATEIEALGRSPSYRERGHTARTLVRKATSRVVLLGLRAGARLDEHKTAHSILVQTLSGHVQLRLPSGTEDVPAHSMLFVAAGVPHDLVALEDSMVLVTINWHGLVP